MDFFKSEYNSDPKIQYLQQRVYEAMGASALNFAENLAGDKFRTAMFPDSLRRPVVVDNIINIEKMESGEIKPPIENVDGIYTDDFKNGRIRLTLDLNYSKEKLKEGVKEAIARYKKSYENALKQRGEEMPSFPKYHKNDFDSYLKVYDLREKGKSWSEVTKELNLNSTSTARYHDKKARDHIEHGIDRYLS